MKIAIIGATGRMGKELLQIIINDPKYKLVAAIISANNSNLNLDVNSLFNQNEYGVEFTSDFEAKDVDVVIDFSSSESSIDTARYCAKNNIPHVIGTTGFIDSQLKEIKVLSKNNKIFLSYNMSLGINILAEIFSKYANILKDNYDISISEIHHKNKKDAPSGTAIMLADQFDTDKIQFNSARIGDVFGQHNVVLANAEEILEFKHIAQNRAIFAKGAIRAAEWLLNQENGLFNMKNMIEN